jgi:hypothetical protein
VHRSKTKASILTRGGLHSTQNSACQYLTTLVNEEFLIILGYNLWILKATFLNRGRGIHVFRDLNSLKTLIMEYCKGVDKTVKVEGRKSSNPDNPNSQNEGNTNGNEDSQNPSGLRYQGMPGNHYRDDIGE